MSFFVNKKLNLKCGRLDVTAFLTYDKTIWNFLEKYRSKNLKSMDLNSIFQNVFENVSNFFREFFKKIFENFSKFF